MLRTEVSQQLLEVVFPEQHLAAVPADKRQALTDCLAQDPRPGYADDPERIYGMEYGGFEVKFRVNETLSVVAVQKTDGENK